MKLTKPATPIGTRVGAMESATADTLRLYGYGQYMGYHPLPKEFGSLHGVPNPKIVLDNGKTVWGAMCWWGEEEKIKQLAATKKHVVMVEVEI